MNLKTCLIIPDVHRPFHSKRAYDLMIKVALDQKIDNITLLGDYADFYSLHQHGAKHPGLPGLLDKEINDVLSGLDELDLLFPRASKTYIQGNHEYRLERFLLSNAAPLLDYVKCDKLFEIHTRKNWTWVPYGPDQIHKILKSKLHARHEPLGPSAKNCAAKALCSLTYGHIHRIEEGHIVGIDGTDYVVFSCGWLGDKTNREVFGYVKNQPQWQLGFAIVYINPKNGYFYHHKIHILDNFTCVFNGKFYKG